MKLKANKSEAKKNVSIVKSSKSNGVENSTVIKEGVPVDHSSKHEPHAPVKFGMSKGCTINVGNYESLRIDVWLTDEVAEGESVKEAYSRVESILDEVLEESVLSTRG